MIPYWLMYLPPAFMAAARLRVGSFGWLLVGVSLTLFIGLRYEVGGDWLAYADHLRKVTGVSFLEAISRGDPGYQIINWAVGYLDLRIWAVNLVCGAIYVSGLIYFVRRLPEPLLGFAVSLPYISFVMAMGYTRQAAAFGFLLFALRFLGDRRLLAFMITLALGALMHKSAVILAPLAALANTRNKALTLVWVGGACAVLYLLILQDHVDAMWGVYVERVEQTGMASEGGAIRVAMNALPAIGFLLLRKRMAMSPEDRALWFWMSLFALACMPLVFLASTAVDRIALYLAPIQLVFAAHLPRIVSPASRPPLRFAICLAYALVLYVWFAHAAHSPAWLPYQFWPLSAADPY